MLFRSLELAGLTGKETVVDAYCGIGTIGIIASKKAGNVIGHRLSRPVCRCVATDRKGRGNTHAERNGRRHDTDNFPIAIGEYVSIEELNEMYEMIEEPWVWFRHLSASCIRSGCPCVCPADSWSHVPHKNNGM